MRFLPILLVIALLCVGCQQNVDDGSLPADQAKPFIDQVKAFKLINEKTVQQNIDRAIASLRSKGVSIVENGWRVYPGPGGCKECKSVHYVVTIDREAEKFEFLVKDGGKTVEGQNEGTRTLLSPPPPKKAEPEKGKDSKQPTDKKAEPALAPAEKPAPEPEKQQAPQ